ncbi:MAG: carboxymethylenebutenolidase [Blastocatellia bacterium]|nr:carboxymethylenebutenolidase [Blastocatellia bacterium]
MSKASDDRQQRSAGVSRRKFLERAATTSAASLITAAGYAATQDAKQQTEQAKQAKQTKPAKPVKLMGKMVEYKSGEMMIPAYLSRAKQKDAPAVLLIHEVFGLNDHIKTVADRLAREGFNTLAPNFFVRASAPPPTDDKDMAALRKAASSIPNEVAIKDMQAALDYLKTVKNVRHSFASIGFCMGGGYSYQIATHTKDLAGAVIFYGRTPLELVPQVSCPLLGNFGGLDAGIPPETIKAFEEALTKAGKTADIKVYPEAKHGFFNDTRPTAYNPEAAADAWQRTLTFFRDRLKA